jgi:hypothetical protein
LFVGLAYYYQGKDIVVFRFIIEYGSLKDLVSFRGFFEDYIFAW